MSRHSGPLSVLPPCNQFDLPLPSGVTDSELSSEQSAKIAKIQLQFAQGVANLISIAFAEVAQVLGENSGKLSTGF